LLKFLSIFFPSIRNLIEIKETQSKLIKNLSNKEYVTVEPIDRRGTEFIDEIGDLWGNKSLVWFIYSLRQDIFSNMIKSEDHDAEAYKNQIKGIELIIKAFEGYQEQYERKQVPSVKGNESTSR